MNKKKVLTIIILALGVTLMIAGVVILAQAGTDHCGHNGGMLRASTSIEFGADFYTSSAQATGLAANAVTDLYKLLSIVSGIFFVFAGGIDLCVTLLLTDMNGLFKKENPTTENTDTENTEPLVIGEQL